MTAIRVPGKINENTTLMDIGMLGIYGVTGVYLVRGERTCLIDAGTRTGALRLVKMLTALDAFPPDLVILTHPHWDHVQGLPGVREAAARQGKRIEAMAAADALPLLADPHFNDVFSHGSSEAIGEVTPVAEGDTVDLGGLTLRFYVVPGHCQGSLAVLDEKNHNLFVGDVLGDKLGDGLFLPPFMPPCWDEEAFLASIEKLRGVDFQSVCFTHFGCLTGNEAASILDDSLKNMKLWWEFYERHAAQLDDNSHLLHAMREEINPIIPPIHPTSAALRALFTLASGMAGLLGKQTELIDKLALGDSLKWLAASYRMAAHPA